MKSEEEKSPNDNAVQKHLLKETAKDIAGQYAINELNQLNYEILNHFQKVKRS